MPAAPVRIAVVGAGHVGATFAYALLLSGLAVFMAIVLLFLLRPLKKAMPGV